MRINESRPRIGIGRPVDQDWLDTTVASIEEVIGEYDVSRMPRLHIRSIPGVSYVSADEMEVLDRQDPGARDVRIEHFLNSLSLNPSTESDLSSIADELTLRLNAFDIVPLRGFYEVHSLKLSLRDKGPSSGEGRRISKEKVALRSLLGLSIKQPSTRHTPRHIVNLGKLKDVTVSDAKEFRRRVSLIDPVPLGPVGPLKI